MSGPGRGLAGSAALMFSGTLVSRVLGLVRNVLLVGAIGVTGAANSFAVANKLPNVVYMLVAGGVLNAILVPQIVRAMKSRDGGDEYVNRLLTMAGAALLALTTLLTAGAVLLVTVYASELDPQWFDLAVAFALWCIPQLFFYGMYTLLGQVLNARGIFGPYMWAPAANNLIAIIGLVGYIVVFGGTPTGAHEDPTAWTPLRTAVIGATATIGVAVQAAVLVIPLRRSGFRFRPRWGLRGSGLGRASKVATWAFASLAVAQLGFIAISNLAAAAAGQEAATGAFVAGNAAWENANFLYMLPQSLITVSLVTALFTRVSDYASAGDTAAVRADLSLGLRTIAVFTVFAGGALSVLALPLIQAVLPTTTRAEAVGIARVVVALLAGIAALGAFTMIQRVYYAFEDTKSLFKLQIPLTAIVIVGCLVSTLLPPTWWLVGAAAATTLSNVVGSVVAYLALRRKLPSLDGARVLRTHVRLVLAAAPALLLGWGLLHLIGPAATAEELVPRLFQAALRIGLVGTVMGVGYLVLLRVLKVEELGVMLRPLGSVLLRVAPRLPDPADRWLGAAGRGLGGSAAVRTMMPDGTGGPGPGSHRGSGTLDEHETGAAPAPEAGALLSGRYRVESTVTPVLPGTTLWRGRDEILEREVQALVLPASAPTALDTLDAARRAALVDDPRLERVLDVGTHEGHAFVVTDVPAGHSLAELAAGGRLSPEQARAIVGEAASALEAARRRGVHHLVLGPSCVHVSDEGQVHLSGLGIAAAYTSADDGDPLAAARADTVGLVRLLHLALTGTWPGPPEGPEASAGVPSARTVGGVPVAPASLREGVPADLDLLCTRTLAAGTDGPRTPSELIRELAPWRDINVEALAGEQPLWAGEDDSAPAGAGAGATSGGAASVGALGAGAAGAAAAGVVAAGVAGAGATAVAGSRADTAETDDATGADDAATGDDAAGSPTPVVEDGATGDATVTGEHADTRGAGTEVDGPSADDAPAGTSSSPSGSLDPSRWQPRELPADHRPADFESVVAPAAVDAPVTAARHPRGSVVSASLGATAGGIAATVAQAARRGGSVLTEKVSSTRDRVSEAAAARAAERERREEEELAAQREADVQAALQRAQQDSRTQEAPYDGSAIDSEAPRAAAGGAPTAGGGAAAGTAAAPATWETVVAPEEPDDGTTVPFRERWLDPTPIVLAIALVAVLVGAILAFRTVTADPEPYVAPTAPPVTSPTPTAGPSPQATATTEAPTATTEPAPPPVVDALSPLDPEGDGAENPDLTDRAIDGDHATFWRSRSYVDPSYGMKSGIGLHIALAEETVVSSVTLDLMGEGGNVEIRATAPDTPTDGEVLASGAMGPDSTFTFSEPVTTDSIVLWFTELPVAASDGRNRIELAELELD